MHWPIMPIWDKRIAQHGHKGGVPWDETIVLEVWKAPEEVNRPFSYGVYWKWGDHPIPDWYWRYLREWIVSDKVSTIAES